MKILRGAAVAILLSSGLLSQSALARSNCAQQFVQDMVSCSQLGTFWDRGACGLDSLTDLARCVKRGV